jgi:secreted PhoX family phosphatase
MDEARKSRRDFLKTGLLAAGGVGLGMAAYYGLRHSGAPPAVHPRLGPLGVVRDETSGLPLLMLPEGFRYRSFAWSGDIMSDGHPGPMHCDGMGVVGDSGGKVTLVRNHELRGSSAPFGDPATAWDVTGGGTTTLVFDTSNETLDSSFVSLNGTLNNCAGGATPWGTWLSCEEAVFSPEHAHYGIEVRQRLWDVLGAAKKHGYVFEVPAQGLASAQPITSMGQFWHEAATVDPGTGIVYMTEDRGPYAGFYRYIPDVPGQLDAGGKLQMMRVPDHPRLDEGALAFTPMRVEWVDIDEPDRGNNPGTHDGKGVVSQGLGAGGTAFRSLEGCDWREGQVFFTSKNGGSAKAGYIFRLDIEGNSLELLFEAPGRGGFSGPDNIIFSPRGSLVICEDRGIGSPRGQYLAGLNASGELFAFAQVNPAISGVYKGHDLSATAAISEWAGVCFSADGQWMFANIYLPGVTCAITGPWADGLI